VSKSFLCCLFEIESHRGSLGWPETHDPCASSSGVLACATTPGFREVWPCFGCVPNPKPFLLYSRTRGLLLGELSGSMRVWI
jgi:hypothetical protein